MKLKKAKAIWELTRLEHGLMYGLGVIIGIIIEDKLMLFNILSIFGFLTALFIEAGVFTLNDYFDIKSDILNERYDRPLVSGDVGRGEVLLIGVISITAGIIFSLFLNIYCFFLAVILAVLGICYDLKIKEFFITSNFFIAFTMTIPFIFGGLIVSQRINFIILILSSIAFLTGFGREIMKDIMDIRGDALRNVRSIARIYGEKKARNITALFYSLAVILSLIPFFIANSSYFLNFAYILPILITDALLMHSTIRLRKGFDIKYMRKETLIAIAIGLFAFICGAYC